MFATLIPLLVLSVLLLLYFCILFFLSPGESFRVESTGIILNFITSDNSGEGYVISRFCMCVYVLFGCMIVSKITQKVVDGL